MSSPPDRHLPALLDSCQDLLGGQLSFSFVVVHSVVGDSGQLPAPVVFIVDVVCHVLQVLHVSSEGGKRMAHLLIKVLCEWLHSETI